MTTRVFKGEIDNEIYRTNIPATTFGVKSGHEETLRYMNKGFTLEESSKQQGRLNEAGMSHTKILIFGGAGRGKGIENAIANAQLINASKPVRVPHTTMGASGTPSWQTMLSPENFSLQLSRKFWRSKRNLSN